MRADPRPMTPEREAVIRQIIADYDFGIETLENRLRGMRKRRQRFVDQL